MILDPILATVIQKAQSARHTAPTAIARPYVPSGSQVARNAIMSTQTPLPPRTSTANYAGIQTDLSNKMKNLYEAARNRGLILKITQASRTPAEQEALYAQGRTTPGKRVTKVKFGRHNVGEAFDVVAYKNGKVSWDPRDYVAIGQLGKAVGLEWGGDWKDPDMPHFQLSRGGAEGEKNKQLQRMLVKAGYKIAVDGKVGPKTRAALVDYQQKLKLKGK